MFIFDDTYTTKYIEESIYSHYTKKSYCKNFIIKKRISGSKTSANTNKLRKLIKLTSKFLKNKFCRSSRSSDYIRKSSYISDNQLLLKLLNNKVDLFTDIDLSRDNKSANIKVIYKTQLNNNKFKIINKLLLNKLFDKKIDKVKSINTINLSLNYRSIK